MSKLAMHVAHYKAGPIGAIDSHNRREHDNHSNELIDADRSAWNMVVLQPEDGKHLWETVQEIANNSSGRVTANSVLMNEWVIYPPEDLQDPFTADPNRLQAWSADVLDWMREAGLHPKQAIIHRDETTVHMHVDGVPLMPDGRLSRKDLYTRTNLSKWHTQLADRLSERGWDIQRGETTKGKKVKSKSVREYKQQAEQERKQLQAEVEDLSKRVEALKALTKPSEPFEGVRTKKTLTGKIKLDSEALEAVEQNFNRLEVENRSQQMNLERAFRELQELRKKIPSLDEQIRRREHLEFLESFWEMCVVLFTKNPELHRDFAMSEKQWHAAINRTLSSPMIWSIQETLDEACGTDFARQNKQEYFQKQQTKTNSRSR